MAGFLPCDTSLSVSIVDLIRHHLPQHLFHSRDRAASGWMTAPARGDDPQAGWIHIQNRVGRITD
jgi:hypothetical protein